MLQTLTRLLLPSGGQQHARQNAWSGMSRDAVRARARREADVAVQRALDGYQAAAR